MGDKLDFSFDKNNFLVSIPNFDDLIEFQEKIMINSLGVPACKLNDTSGSSITWTAQLSERFTDKQRESIKAIQDNCLDIINIHLTIKPKRLPRKLKKAYKKGLSWAVKKINKKYPSYMLKDCKLQFDSLNEDLMEQVININCKEIETNN